MVVAPEKLEVREGLELLRIFLKPKTPSGLSEKYLESEEVA